MTEKKENKYRGFFMNIPRGCLDCPLSVKNGNDLGCCLSINAHANVTGICGDRDYKSYACPLITGIDDTDFVQNELERERENDRWWREHSSRFD